jgi:hypothetical protein
MSLTLEAFWAYAHTRVFRQYCRTANKIRRAETIFRSAPILAHPTPREEFVVGRDSSDFGIGGVFSYVQDGQERVIAYYSNTSIEVEGNYCVTRRELKFNPNFKWGFTR